MNSRITAIIILVVMTIGMLAGCGGDDGSRGMKADEPYMVVEELLRRYYDGGDYMELCSAKLEKKDIEIILEDLRDCYFHFMTGENGAITFIPTTDTSGSVLSLLTSAKGTGRATVSLNEKSGKYVITAFSYDES